LNETLPGLEKMFERMSNESSWADVLMGVLLGCQGWPIKAVDPPMDWDDHPAYNPKPINTSYPLLFISNTYDPITPMYGGLKMAKKFAGAGFIEQLSEGHCSLAAVSLCTIGKVRSYFREGKLPPPPVEGKGSADGEWEKCKADEWPFHPFTKAISFAKRQEIDVAEVERLDAVKEMQKVFQKMRQWGQPQSARLNLEQLI
jgi:hypothetical protein